MFELPFEASATVRSRLPQRVAGFVATFSLVTTIIDCIKSRIEALPMRSGFISGPVTGLPTSFANLVLAISRTLTDTFSGNAPANAPPFNLAQRLAATVVV